MSNENYIQPANGEKPETQPDNSSNPETGSQNSVKDPLAWEEIRCEHLVWDEWIDFRRSAFRFPDGSVFEPYYSYSLRDYVVIVASDEEGNDLCVRQYRQGIRQVTTEFPAGGIERKDDKEYRSPENGESEVNSHGGIERKDTRTSADMSAEDALEAAKRELLEETGYESDEWEHLLTVPSNATIADNYGHLFMARNCRRVAKQKLDDTEFLNVLKLSADEIEDLILKGKFQQAIHITAWLLALRHCTR